MKSVRQVVANSNLDYVCAEHRYCGKLKKGGINGSSSCIKECWGRVFRGRGQGEEEVSARHGHA